MFQDMSKDFDIKRLKKSNIHSRKILRGHTDICAADKTTRIQRTAEDKRLASGPVIY